MSAKYFLSAAAATLLTLLPASVPSYAQATAAGAATGAKTWMAKAAEIEQELKTSAIERFEDLGTGVTRPKRGYLKPGGVVESLVWKLLPPGMRNSYWESYKSEIAAYELDKLLGMYMVPPAVERDIRGDKGAAVMWVSQTTSVKELGGKIPTDRVSGGDLRKMLTFDNLIGNPDRNAGNILIDPANNIILIDHSRAFTMKTELPAKVERVDATLWTAIEGVSPEAFHQRLDPVIGKDYVEAMIKRRARMEKDIDALIAAKKSKVLVVVP